MFFVVKIELSLEISLQRSDLVSIIRLLRGENIFPVGLLKQNTQTT